MLSFSPPVTLQLVIVVLSVIINIPPSVDIVTVYQTEPHTGSLDGSLHCTTKLQAVIVSGEIFIISSGGPGIEVSYQVYNITILSAYYSVHIRTYIHTITSYHLCTYVCTKAADDYIIVKRLDQGK